MWKNIVAGVLVALALAGPVPEAVGIGPYTATKIELPPGLNVNSVTGMNGMGHVTLTTGGLGTYSYLWSAGTLTSLPGEGLYMMTSVAAVNNEDKAVGQMLWYTQSFAVSWTHGQMTMLDLGAMASSRSSADAISNGGLIVGLTQTPQGTRLYTLDAQGVVMDCGSLPTSFLRVMDANESGQVVLMEGALMNGYLYSGGQFFALPDLQGGNFGAVQAINDNGLMVGMSYPRQANGRAAYWLAGGQAPCALPVPDGTTGSMVMDVNNLGQMVGYYDQSGRRACMWDSDGTFHDLADLVLDETVRDLLTMGCQINDCGQIAAQSGSLGYLLTPIPEPATLSLLALGLSAFVLRRRRPAS